MGLYTDTMKHQHDISEVAAGVICLMICIDKQIHTVYSITISLTFFKVVYQIVQDHFYQN